MIEYPLLVASPLNWHEARNLHIYPSPNSSFLPVTYYGVPRPRSKMNPPTQEESAILFQAENAILLDIPHSIALAQGWPAPREPGSRTNHSPRKIPKLLSCTPMKESFPSTEPKKPAALARVLESIPVSERRFAELIVPLVRDALKTISAGFPSERRWCFPRAVPNEDAGSQSWNEGPRKRRREDVNESTFQRSAPGDPVDILSQEPPMILSTSSVNRFAALSDLTVVKNPSPETAIIRAGASTGSEYIIPPMSSFILGTLPLFQTKLHHRLSTPNYPIPGLSTHQKFNLILMDPPWPNRSVRRSGHYQTHHYSEMDALTTGLRDILRAHLLGTTYQVHSTSESPFQSQQSIAAIWITNAEKSRRAAYEALIGAGLCIREEWVWVKTTWNGEPISALDGLWRKPYEILVIGTKDDGPDLEIEAPLMSEDDLMRLSEAVTRRRVIAAVPDLHSRKPNLKAVFEEVFFTDSGELCSYSALEVFARNLTAGWSGVGNEVLRFNARECWVESDV
ncbi:uncharacterized protein N7515_003805 [Penicillium bovifimosum]|uniref:Uncharacterized protein n=1 Tax=Penicillium bovifimosum TaxID=126998 RepID=A0A9W9L6K5_9EURO|nr:uncharacterized protein N7515_003805 [Penicillium bovifimosum]KAJ5138957.1 hypothetical protein N7515_003805 [Penicillium bovifimosum]